MKILVISDYRETVSVRPEAELYIRLAQHEDVEIEIMTFGEAEYVQKFQAAGIKVIDFYPPKKRDSSSIERIKTTLLEGKHDILHLYTGIAITNGIPAAKKLPVKIVLYRGYTGNIHWYDPSAYFKYLSPHVDSVWCIADATRDLIQRNLLFQKNQPVSITKGHLPEWYEGVQKADLTDLNLPSNAFIAAHVSNVRPMKGIPYLIKATYYLPPELPIYFLFAGKGMETEGIPALIENSPNKDKIILLGYRKDAKNIVKASNIFILASIKGEAINKAVIEAMSLGICPIITDIPGNKKLVVNKESGLVVPSKDPKALAKAIQYAYEQPEAVYEMAKNAKKRMATHFHIDDTVAAIKKWYAGLI